MRTSTFISILPLLASALAAPQPRSFGQVVKRDHGSMSGGYSGAYSYSPPAEPEKAMSHDTGGEKAMPPPTKEYNAEPPAEYQQPPAPPAEHQESPPPAEHQESPPPPMESQASPPPPPMGHEAASPPSDLNSCVQMCQAQFGGGHDAIMGMDKMGGGAAPPPPPPSGTEGGAPATHTIIVAPTKGVLRFVPFATTANPGDKLHFIWGAGPHSSTLSLGTSVCNKSTEAGAFDSGKLNATATFETTFEGDPTKPQFHYCTVGQHCVGGMFGVVNPPTTNVSNELTDKALTPSKTQNAPGAGSTAGSGGGGCDGNSMDCWVERWMASSPEAQASGKAVKDACASSPEAWAWGGKFDMSSMESDSMPRKVMIENVMYTRLMIASNPSMINGTTPSDYVSVPELNSFVAQQTGINSTDGAGADGGAPQASGGEPSASAAVPSSSGDASAAQAQDATPSGGASSRTTLTASSTLLGLFGVVLAWAL